MSHDAQGRWREIFFGDRARGAKIGPSEDKGEVGKLSESKTSVWALGAREPKNV